MFGGMNSWRAVVADSVGILLDSAGPEAFTVRGLRAPSGLETNTGSHVASWLSRGQARALLLFMLQCTPCIL